MKEVDKIVKKYFFHDFFVMRRICRHFTLSNLRKTDGESRLSEGKVFSFTRRLFDAHAHTPKRCVKKVENEWSKGAE